PAIRVLTANGIRVLTDLRRLWTTLRFHLGELDVGFPWSSTLENLSLQSSVAQFNLLGVRQIARVDQQTIPNDGFFRVRVVALDVNVDLANCVHTVFVDLVYEVHLARLVQKPRDRLNVGECPA